jgi:hypothetical protein
MSMNPIRKNIEGGTAAITSNPGTPLILPNCIKSVQLKTIRRNPLVAWSNVPNTTPSDLFVRFSRVVSEMSFSPLFPDVRISESWFFCF